MNYLIKVSYDGTNYHGFQVQPGKVTIQGELEKAIKQITGEAVRANGSGRTDAGVHASCQPVSFTLGKEIETYKLQKGLNAVLPSDIRVTSAEVVADNFHARFSAKSKIYEYNLVYSYDAFNIKYAELVKNDINIKAMEKASKCLLGKHDFTSFSSASADVNSYVKSIYSIRFIKKENGITIQVAGSGFLHNMVRIIVSTLIEVGQGKREVSSVKEILNAKDRKLAGKTAPAKGLTLKDVKY